MTTIPVEVDDVTPGWLSEVLGAPVRTAEVTTRHSGTTGRVGLALTYEGGAEGPASVFVKLAPFDERQRRFVDAVGMGVAEARFYGEVAPDVPVRVPRPYFAATDDDGRYVMVLEDLAASGGRFPTPDDPGIADFAGRLVRELATLHARYWERPALTGALGWVSEGPRLAFEGGGRYIAKALDAFGDEMGDTFRRLARRYVDETPAIAELFADGPHTLVHGDPHLGNLFDDGGRPGFFDWAMVMRRAGMWDVAYVLCNSVPTDVRRSHEDEWIASYIEALGAGGVHLEPSDAWQQYRLFAVYSWVAATSTAAAGSRWQAEEVGRGGMERATRAVEDLASLARLHELLDR